MKRRVLKMITLCSVLSVLFCAAGFAGNCKCGDRPRIEKHKHDDRHKKEGKEWFGDRKKVEPRMETRGTGFWHGSRHGDWGHGYAPMAGWYGYHRYGGGAVKKGDFFSTYGRHGGFHRNEAAVETHRYRTEGERADGIRHGERSRQKDGVRGMDRHDWWSSERTHRHHGMEESKEPKGDSSVSESFETVK